MNVYLAGPITGQDYTTATLWRNVLRERLLRYGINAYSPLRGKQFLVGETALKAYGYTHPLATDRGIVGRDRFDVQNADIVLVNLLGAQKVSIGTMVELGWADMERRPILLVMEREGNVHDHAFVRALATWVVETLEEAEAILKVTSTYPVEVMV